jgi:hypothetical protein
LCKNYSVSIFCIVCVKTYFRTHILRAFGFVLKSGVTDEQVLASMFSLNGRQIFILFDTGATHDFISKAYTQKYQLAIEHTNTPYMISTPGGNVITKQLVMHVPLNLKGKLYKTSLIILDGQGIDVTLGMSWMKEHRALLDTVYCIVHLYSLVHGIVVLHLSSPSVTNPLVHHTIA